MTPLMRHEPNGSGVGGDFRLRLPENYGFARSTAGTVSPLQSAVAVATQLYAGGVSARYASASRRGRPPTQLRQVRPACHRVGSRVRRSSILRTFCPSKT